MIMVLKSRGTEYTNEMNIPLESKYWNLEKDLKQNSTVNDQCIFLDGMESFHTKSVAPLHQ